MATIQLPLVFSCSGCSNIAQLANQVAIELDRDGFAEMSCIAGIGGDVKSIVRQASNAQQIIILDGCALQCANNCLARHNISAKHHYILTDYGIKKRKKTDFNSADIDLIKRIVLADLH